MSKKIFGILLIINVLSLSFFHNWEEWLLINGDSYGYYAYLPITFIHHDFKTLQLETYYRTKNQISHKDENYTPETMPERWLPGVLTSTGQRVNIYTCGVALMQLPFFLLAHILALLLGFAADGYSLPYRIMLLFGNLFYVMCGLWFLGKILRGYFSKKTTNLTLIISMLTTNLFYFTAFSGFMAHSYLFCLVVFLLYFTLKFHKTEEPKYLISLGFIGGLITLMRPSDGLFLLMPILFKINSLPAFFEKINLLWSKRLALIVASMAFCLPFLPQLFYWKYVTGNWFFNSYGEHFRFDFAHPHIQEGLIGMSNGWLIYTPVMAFALIGILMMRDKQRDFLLPIAVILPIYIYVIYAWWCFNYINGFGSRPMIDLYPLLAIPLSVFIEKMLKSNFSATIFLIIVVFLTGLNLFQTWQMSQKIIISEENNAAFWLESFGKTTLNYNALVAFDSKELQPKQTIFIKKMFEENFELPSVKDTNFIQNPCAAGHFSYRVNTGAYSTGFHTEVKNLQGGRYVKIMLKAYSFKNSIWDIYQKSILVVDFQRNSVSQKWRGMRIENKIGNQTAIYGGQNNVWDDLYFYVKIPEDALPDDVFSCYVWNQNRDVLVIDDFKVELFR